MEELLTHLNELLPMPPDLTVAIMQGFSKEVFRVNRPIVSSDSPQQWYLFIEAGFGKLTFDNGREEERIFGFYRKGSFILPVRTASSNDVSRFTITPTQETIVRKIKDRDLNLLCEKFPLLHIHLRKLLEIQYLELEDYLLLGTFPPKERFHLLLQQDNWLLHHSAVKDYMLASYLGIDKATLSRYRKKLSA